MKRLATSAALFGAAISFLTTSANAAPLGGSLSQLVSRWENGDPDLSGQLAHHLTSRGGDPLVVLHLAEGVSAESVLPELSAAGFRLTARSSIDPRVIEGYLPLGSSRGAAGVPGVRTVRALHEPKSNAGAVQSQAVALQKSDRAQARGFDGSGIRIGALSDSFDKCRGCATNAAADLASGDLSPVTVLQDQTVQNSGASDEGRAMLQLIHDVAPGAQLGFASAFNGEVQFAENIIALQ